MSEATDEVRLAALERKAEELEERLRRVEERPRPLPIPSILDENHQRERWPG